MTHEELEKLAMETLDKYRPGPSASSEVMAYAMAQALVEIARIVQERTEAETAAAIADYVEQDAWTTEAYAKRIRDGSWKP